MLKKISMVAFASLILGSSLMAAPRSKSVSPVLSQEQKNTLLFMYQEEKVARDVYITLGTKYRTASVFSNIAISEQTHMDSVEKLCLKYGVNISGINEADVGKFILPELQNLYNTLVSQGSTSLTEGLKVGVAIEIKDIEDLNAAKISMPYDIVQVFDNLKAGSSRHLIAFKKAL